MSDYKFPGVYVDLQTSGFRPVSAAGTSTVAFVGTLPGHPEHKVRVIRSQVDYDRLVDQTTGGRDDAVDDMGDAVTAFYANGGGKAYICPVVDDESGANTGLFKDMIAALPDVSIIVLPGRVYSADGGKDVIDQVITFAESYGAMVIVDLPEELQDDLPEIPSSPCSVAYHPWVQAKDGESKPPSAYAAGLWARTDARRGVWKAPAGTETRISAIVGLTEEIVRDHGGELTDRGINCLRTVPGYGTVIWGARTLAAESKPEWRYISVRRTAQMLQRSIHNSIQWAVFEPNNERLWSTLRANIESFMNGLFRAEAFQGSTASQAYFVRCGLDDTMTQSDVDAGRVIVEVGFAPVKPAEFVVVQIQQIVKQ